MSSLSFTSVGRFRSIQSWVKLCVFNKSVGLLLLLDLFLIVLICVFQKERYELFS